MSTQSTSPLAPPEPQPLKSVTPRFGLRFKVLLALTLFNILAIGIFSVDRYAVEKARIMDGLRAHLDASAKALPDMLPSGYLDRAADKGAVSEEEYKLLMEKLSHYCDSTGLRYLYTYRLVGDSFHCTATNGTREERRSGTYTRYWAKYETAPVSIFRAMETGEPVYEEVSDQWGRTFTLFLPLRTRGGLRYVAGADLSTDFVQALLSDSLRRTVLLGLGGFFLCFIVSWWGSSRFSQHITLLARYTHELAAAKFTGTTDTPVQREVKQLPLLRSDEVGQLAESFIAMEEKLQSYLRELTETTAAKERIQGELRIAGEIQASMLPLDYVCPHGRARVDIAASMKPAKEAGGDLYDLIELDEDHLLFAIADVSDKGMPAALFMAATVTILRARASAGLAASPEVLLAQVNDQLIRQNSMCQFVTVFMGVIQLSTGLVTYSDGGHNRPYVREAGGKARMLPRGGGIALGVMPEASFLRHTLQLNAGDTLLLYTDGVTEAIAANETFYGEPRLEALLNTMSAEAGAKAWVSVVTEDVARFSHGHVQADDITVLALKYLG